MIVACTIDGGIGLNDEMPWHIPTELRKFRILTSKTSGEGKMNAVVMGRRTWESIGSRPLRGRLNVVISSSMKERNEECEESETVIISRSFEEAFLSCKKDNIETIYVIGGSTLYNHLLERAGCAIKPYVLEKIYLSVMHYNRDHKTDTQIKLGDVFRYFDWKKDTEFPGKGLFSSYICDNKYLKQDLA